jgi:hypothetical protein
MIVTYFRSSSWNNFDNCQMQYYLCYTLGLSNPSGRKASMGNVTHKALECLAAYKLCLQNGTTSFIDDSLGEINISECDPDHLVRISFDWHVEHEKHDWDLIKDFKECKSWMYKALTFQNGTYDPRNRKVVMPEQRFDLSIDKAWAKYHYQLPNGEVLDGTLSIKGTVDLITEIKPGILEMIDWKTGATMNDFATGKKKDFISLHTDPQLRLYHYAAHKLYPDVDDIIITIYFIRAGGPFSLMLSKDDLEETENMIRIQFEKVRNTKIPQLNPGPSWSDHPNPLIASFKCHKLCTFSKPNEKYDATKPVCKFFKEQIEVKGIDKVTEEFGDMSKINRYMDGGGKKAPKIL